MSIIVLFSAVLIGLSLGVFGSGGAILTLPTLIYLLQVDEKLAVIGSLIVVSIISLLTLIPHIKQKNISYLHVGYFAFPSVITSYFGGYLGSAVESWLQLSVFIILMLLAALKMLLSSSTANAQENLVKKLHLIFSGFIVGFATGFVGVGGGFLIVPALIFLGRLDITKATSTSLAIIVIQSAAGVLSYYQYSPSLFSQLPMTSLIVLALVGVIGAFSGTLIKQKLPSELLSKVFAYFLLFMTCFILIDRVLL